MTDHHTHHVTPGLESWPIGADPEPSGMVTLREVQAIREELTRLARRIQTVPDDAPYNPTGLTPQQRLDGYARSINLANEELASLYPEDRSPVSGSDLVRFVARAARELEDLRAVAAVVGDMTAKLGDLRTEWEARP